MGVLRFLPSLMLFVLLGGHVLLLSERAYAGPCMCGQVCPQRSCYCDCHCLYTCAVDDYSQISATHSANFQIRNVHSPLLTTDRADNDLPGAVTLLGMTKQFLTLKCQRIKEMLEWASDFSLEGAGLQLTLR
jgi:hypothetical protein